MFGRRSHLCRCGLRELLWGERVYLRKFIFRLNVKSQNRITVWYMNWPCPFCLWFVLFCFVSPLSIYLSFTRHHLYAWNRLYLNKPFRLFSSNRSSKSQVYTLIFGSQKVPLFCHMGNFGCGDGGWTLAMKIDGTKVTRLCLYFGNEITNIYSHYSLCTLKVKFVGQTNRFTPRRRICIERARFKINRNCCINTDTTKTEPVWIQTGLWAMPLQEML